MRNEYEKFIESIETATTQAVEYETTHEDSGANYLHCVPDQMTYNNADARLVDWLAVHDIETTQERAAEFLEYAAQMDLIEPTAGSIFGNHGVRAFYSKDEYHASAPYTFCCASMEVGEVETHLSLSDLTSSRFAKAFARKADNDNRVCIREVSQGEIASYEATDAVWFYLVELENYLDWQREYYPDVLEACYLDCCLPGYFMGSSMPTMAVPMHTGITYAQALSAAIETAGMDINPQLEHIPSEKLSSALRALFADMPGAEPADFAKYVEPDPDGLGDTVYLYIGFHLEDA